MHRIALILRFVILLSVALPIAFVGYTMAFAGSCISNFARWISDNA